MEGLLVQNCQHPLTINAKFASEETTDRSRGYFGVSAESVQVRKDKVEEDRRFLEI